MTPTKPDPMSVTMESVLIVKMPGCTHKHRLTMEKALDLYSRLARFISSNAQTEGAQRVREIQACTIEHFGLSGDVFMGTARQQVYSWPRFVAMALARELVPELNPREIGNAFGRERTIIDYAVNEVAARLATYPEKRKDVDAIRAKLNGQNGGAH